MKKDDHVLQLVPTLAFRCRRQVASRSAVLLQTVVGTQLTRKHVRSTRKTSTPLEAAVTELRRAFSYNSIHTTVKASVFQFR